MACLCSIEVKVFERIADRGPGRCSGVGIRIGPPRDGAYEARDELPVELHQRSVIDAPVEVEPEVIDLGLGDPLDLDGAALDGGGEGGKLYDRGVCLPSAHRVEASGGILVIVLRQNPAGRARLRGRNTDVLDGAIAVAVFASTDLEGGVVAEGHCA